VRDPERAVLIHAAARVAWNAMDGLTANAAMATNVALWAREAGMGFAVLVSGVNVYAPLPYADLTTPCEPRSLYGQGKCVAEDAWRLVVPAERSAVVRLAGVWGWQPKPTLFWNRLLLAACGATDEPPVVKRSRSRRNYISSLEASECLLQIGVRRMPGLFLGAGKDVIDTRQFIEAVQRLTGSTLRVEWQDDGQVDECLYRPSAELSPWLKPFPDILSTIWSAQPDWVCSR
jgi:nucleoside-diphosphate-sugar epimerase